MNNMNGMEDYSQDENILEKFGERVRKLRIKQGISQEKFALKIGMDRAYYSSVENGKHSISLEKIELIARGLEVKLEVLFKGLDNE